MSSSTSKITDSLHAKIAEVTAAIGAMPKDRTVEVRKNGQLQYTYDYLSESALMNAVRAELSKRGVAVYVSVDSQERAPLGEKGNFLTTVSMSMTFVDSESKEQFTIHGQGSGMDHGDKGVYKAITGCTRYMLWKQFLIPTEQDDPVQSVDERSDPKPEQDRRESRGGGTDAPVSLGEVIARLEHFFQEPKEWIKEAITKLYPEVSFEKWGDLDDRQQIDVLKRLQQVVVDLEGASGMGFEFSDSDETRDTIRSAFELRFEGLVISGPEEFKGPVPF